MIYALVIKDVDRKKLEGYCRSIMEKGYKCLFVGNKLVLYFKNKSDAYRVGGYIYRNFGYHYDVIENVEFREDGSVVVREEH